MNDRQAVTVALEDEKRLCRQNRPHSLKTMAELEAYLGADFLEKQKASK